MADAVGSPGGSIAADLEPRADRWTIEPTQAGFWPRLREFIRYRRITWFLATRTIRRRYEGLVLGRFWMFARPLAPIALSAFIFGGLLRVDSGPVPYFLFFLAGVVTWSVFDRTLNWVTRSLDLNKGLVKKVYFPRLVIPVSAIAPAMVEFGIYITLLIGTILYFGFTSGRWYVRLDAGLLLAPVAMALGILCALAIGLFTCVWQGRARDVRYGLRYVTQFWFYLTPVIYPLSSVPVEYRGWMYLNPMTGVVETFKWSALGIGELNLAALGASSELLLIVLWCGLIYFDRAEGSSVDQL